MRLMTTKLPGPGPTGSESVAGGPGLARRRARARAHRLRVGRRRDWPGLFELRFTDLSLPSRRTIHGPDDVAVSQLLDSEVSLSQSDLGNSTAEYHGGLVVQRRRWTRPTSPSAG